MDLFSFLITSDIRYQIKFLRYNHTKNKANLFNTLLAWVYLPNYLWLICIIRFTRPGKGPWIIPVAIYYHFCYSPWKFPLFLLGACCGNSTNVRTANALVFGFIRSVPRSFGWTPLQAFNLSWGAPLFLVSGSRASQRWLAFATPRQCGVNFLPGLQ